jgi:Ca2+-binding EF-hand superfamily protein
LEARIMLGRTAWQALGVAGAFCLALPVMAAEGERKGPNAEKQFQKKDVDGDGLLSLEEFKAGMPEKMVTRADVRFKKLDTNGDGKLTLEEFRAGMQPKK